MHHIKAVIKMHNGKKKASKGFSPNELKEAGLTRQEARHIGFPVDGKRKSTHKENVETIKAHAESHKEEDKAKAAAAPAVEAKATEKKPKKKAKS
jgi:large subunit ribosomal protein L13e